MDGTIIYDKSNGKLHLPDGEKLTGKIRALNQISEGRGVIVGLVGAPGIGKGFITQGLRRRTDNLHFLPRITTRHARVSDPYEGVVAVSQEEFQKLNGHIIGVHRPFGDHRMYGWYIEEAVKGLPQGMNYITDPNVELLGEFYERFDNDLHLIGFTARPDYLKHNLSLRVRTEKGRLTDQDIWDVEKRLNVGIAYNEAVREARKKGLLHELIDIDFGNREDIVDMVRENLKRSRGLFETNREEQAGIEGRNGKSEQLVYCRGGVETL